MAKKGARRSAPARRSGPSKSRTKRTAQGRAHRPRRNRHPLQHRLSWQLSKAVLGLAILVMLVVSAAAMAHHLLLRAPYGRLAKPIPPAAPPHASESRPTASAVRHKVPAYEIFDQHTPPEPEATPQPPVPSDGKRRPLVAIIIDDLGYDYQLAAHFLELDGPFTFSMLPRGPFTRKIIAEAHAKGNEIMLHLPMEPMEYPEVSPGPGALLAGMTPDELLAQLDADLAAIPHVKGVNNHMGSRLSTLAPQMRQIFSRLKARGLYYIDSRTTKETVGRPAAERLQLNFAERDIFIDHFQDADFIRQQLRRLIQRAYAQGYAIGIAHPHPLTIELIKAGLPDLKKQVSLVPVSAVVQVAG